MPFVLHTGNFLRRFDIHLHLLKHFQTCELLNNDIWSHRGKNMREKERERDRERKLLYEGNVKSVDWTYSTFISSHCSHQLQYETQSQSITISLLKTLSYSYSVSLSVPSPIPVSVLVPVPVKVSIEWLAKLYVRAQFKMRALCWAGVNCHISHIYNNSPKNYSTNHSTIHFYLFFYSTSLYSTPLYSTLLYSAVLYSIALCSTVVYCSLLPSIILISK